MLEDKIKICAWKVIQQNPNSTTFYDVKDKEHKLYACIECDGKKESCQIGAYVEAK